MSDPQRALPDYFYIIGSEGARMLRMMPPSAGSAWLAYKYPELSDTQRANALTLCQPDAPRDDRYARRYINFNDRLFVAAAWLAGASLNQLARLQGSSRQAISDRLDRMIERSERNACRLVEPPISEDRILVMKSAFDVMTAENDNVFEGFHPVRVAALLMAVPHEPEGE